jgi:hypothetical protein
MGLSLSDERTCLSFIIAGGPQQRSHSQVLVSGTRAIFYVVRFETTLFVSYNSQGYGGGIRPRPPFVKEPG